MTNQSDVITRTKIQSGVLNQGTKKGGSGGME